jgi:hypothetical protein
MLNPNSKPSPDLEGDARQSADLKVGLNLSVRLGVPDGTHGELMFEHPVIGRSRGLCFRQAPYLGCDEQRKPHVARP